ncbi:MAG: universal stress protein [Planctomycetaceae bacterium]
MDMIRRILCPTDFSTTASNAMRYAERLAMQVGADLYLVHAFDTPVEMTLAGQSQPLDINHQTQLNQLLVDSPLANRVIRILHAGPAGEVACWLAQEHKCDLIIMGTHGRSGLTHLFFGSIAEYVLRNARCPVLTIRDRPELEPPLQQPLVIPIKAPRFM